MPPSYGVSPTPLTTTPHKSAISAADDTVDTCSVVSDSEAKQSEKKSKQQSTRGPLSQPSAKPKRKVEKKKVKKTPSAEKKKSKRKEKHTDEPLSSQQERTMGATMGNARGRMTSDEGTNLIINYLPKSIDEDALFDLFCRFGDIVRCKVVINRVTRNSECYGFVLFSTVESAREAIQKMNGYRIFGKRLKVSVSQRDSEQAITTLYIGGLPISYTEYDISLLFFRIGLRVIAVRLLVDQRFGVPKGSAFIEVASQEEALIGIKALNKYTPPGCKKFLSVRIADRPRESAARKMRRSSSGSARPAFSHRPPPHLPAYTHLPPHSTPQFSLPLHLPYSQTSSPTSSIHDVPHHRPSIDSSFSLISDTSNSFTSYSHSPGPYDSYPSVPAGIRQQYGLEEERYPAYGGACMFIYHLPPEANESDLYQLFTLYGTVISTKVMRDPETGESKGYGFVNVSKRDEADRAIEAINGKPLWGKFLAVSHKQ